MELNTALQNLQEECGCPLCLDYFEDPVSISCGHNFCLDCLSLSWKDVVAPFPCPQCQMVSMKKSFPRNLQLGNIIEIAKLLQVRRSPRKRRQPLLCRAHKRPLVLYCTEDLEFLCMQCSFLEPHVNHELSLIRKVAPEHWEYIERKMKLWKMDVKYIEKFLHFLQTRKSLELRTKVEGKRREIRWEFHQIQLFLQDQQEAFLKDIHVEELHILSKLHRNLQALADHASALQGTLREVEAKSEWSDGRLLTHVPQIYHRSKTLKCPAPLSFGLKAHELRLPAQYSAFDKIIRRFQVNVGFDDSTAHPQLVVSEDRKSVLYERVRRRVCYNPRRFYSCPAVLGSEHFDSGRHYWEVEVGNKPQWTLGVCQNCLPKNWRNQPSVVDGFWAIGQYDKSGYVAFGPQKTQFLPAERPRKIGIFLDYELGEISFYNTKDRSLLYEFSDTFTSTIWPYFYAGTDAKPLKIVPLPD